MEIVKPVSLPIPNDFSAFERFLVEKTEIALVDGLALERWSRDPNRLVEFHKLDLAREYALKNEAFGYFGDVTIQGQRLTALGARQNVEFGKIDAPNPEEKLRDYVLKQFMNNARWTYPDKAPGGFDIEQMLYCTADGTYGRYAKDNLSQVRDWNEMGPKYRWSLFTIYLHDFVMKMGPIKKALKEAVSVVQHPDFIHIIENPRPGYKLEVSIGYPFIDYAPIPNNFGFGPGKFNWAIKTFQFFLRDNNEVLCEMDFVAGARPKKVFDFGKGIPCPMYGTSDGLEAVTFGLYKSQPFRDWMDLQMSTQHSRVHQALMEGTAKYFAKWLKETA